MEHSAADLLEAGLAELGLALGPTRTGALLELARLLERWSGHMNLTAHRSAEAIVRRLVLDAAALSGRLPELESLVDLGSGAGFPGLPLAILRPGCRLTLVDSRERRHHFQRSVRRELGLENVEPRLGRAEELPVRLHEAAIAQALAQPEQALRWMARWVEPGGLLLLPGAETPPRVPELPGIRKERLERYRVPCGGPRRTLWIGRLLRAGGD